VLLMSMRWILSNSMHTVHTELSIVNLFILFQGSNFVHYWSVKMCITVYRYEKFGDL
jgi:hypothetical protein